MKKSFIILIIFLFIVLSISTFLLKTHVLSKEQKEIIVYLDKINSIYKKASSTLSTKTGLLEELMVSKEAIKIVDAATLDIENIKRPKECRAYRQFCVEALNYIKKLHMLREMIDNSKFFSSQERLKMQKRRLLLEAKISKENWRLVYEIGILKVLIYRFLNRT